MTAVAGLLGVWPSAAQSGDDPALPRTDVSFTVTNLEELGGERQIHGYRVDPPCEAKTVVLLQHGLSYTSEAWDFPGYSYARTLTRAGYAVVAIDRLGYAKSTLENGYLVSSEIYAHIASQIVEQLRADYEHVAIGGHSAGAEVTELTAGLFGGVDAVIGMGYTHFPSIEIYTAFLTGDIPRALTDDYEYFLGTPEYRADMFFTADAEPAVIAEDRARAVPTPSGEILTIGPQPSRAVVPLISVPVFLQLADGDRLFPMDMADLEAALYLAAPSVTVDRVPDAGHTFMLHPSGRAAADRLAAWLQAQPGTPPCEPAPAAPTAVAGVSVERGAPAPAPGTPAPGAPAPGGQSLPATGGGGPALGLGALALAVLMAAGRRAARAA
jgi:pimeloyl-ACP methyl ester carboxylesterase